MTGKSSRDKGQRGEREVIAILQTIVNDVCGDKAATLCRNLVQTRDGGHDILGLSDLKIEVKYQETLHLDEWWSQARSQCHWATDIPILIYRRSRVPWRVRMVTRAYWSATEWVPTLSDISIDHFCGYLRSKLTSEMAWSSLCGEEPVAESQDE